MKTEKEIYDELSTTQKHFADKYKYSNCLFRFKVNEVIEGYDSKKLNENEVIGWIKKLIDVI